MASAPIDRPEFSFHPVNLVQEVITLSAPGGMLQELQTGLADIFTRLAQAGAHFKAIGLDQAELDAMIR